jgi:multidrug resistance efflux pump
MEAVIAAGGSVLHAGRILVRVEDLPTEAALASTEAEKADASAALHAKVAALQAQIEALGAAAPPPKGGRAA